MKRVLIVDDDKNICEVLRIYLEHEGYQLYFATNGSEAVDAFRYHKPDIILLDLMLPLINGWEVCKLIRRESQVPVIMLTAKETVEDKIAGLDMGADDYIIKPFDPKEVVARVRALLRRVNVNIQSETSTEILTLGDLWVNLATYQVKVKEQPVQLKTREMELLVFLMQNPNIVFSREQLLQKVWGYDYMGESRTVDVHIQRLRDKLQAPEAKGQIKTVWGVGYKFEVN